MAIKHVSSVDCVGAIADLILNSYISGN